jgi:hypothetical protein
MNKKELVNYILMGLFYLIFLMSMFLLGSCRSAQRHIEIALKKDPNIILCDTIKTVEYIKEEVFKTSGKDSIIIDNKRLLLKVYGEGKLDLFYILKSDSIELNDIIPVITPKSSRQEIRQKEKTARYKIKKETQVQKVIEKTKPKIIKQQVKAIKRKWWDNFKVGFTSSFLIVALIYFLKNYYENKSQR